MDREVAMLAISATSLRIGYDIIGVEKSLSTLPSLRTVRAVLPHTALQSAVSISGQIDDLNLLQGASVIATE